MFVGAKFLWVDRIVVIFTEFRRCLGCGTFSLGFCLGFKNGCGDGPNFDFIRDWK